MKTKTTRSPISQIPSSNYGFTLIEILVVFTVVAILSGIGFGAFVSYSRSQEVNQTASNVRLLISQARFNALSAVKRNTDKNGDTIDCANETLQSYNIDVVSSSQIDLSQVCSVSGTTIIKSIYLPSSLSVVASPLGSTSCSAIRFSALTTTPAGTPCSIVISGFGKEKTVTIDTIGNSSVQ